MRCFVVVHVVLVLAIRVAHADTIALISDDAALHAALVDAGDSVAVTNEAAPDVGQLAASSRLIADRLGASVTVWLIPGGTGGTTSLVTYDRVTDRVIVRELPYAAPLDAARATEAARIVRTMLRSMRTPDEPTRTPTPALNTARGAAVAQRGVTTPVVTPEPRFAIGVGGGVWVAAPGALANPVVTLAATWRPHGLGAAVTATLAPEPKLEMPSFRGDVRDIVVGGVVRNALALATADVRFVPSAGVALHVIHVTGTNLDTRRFDPAIRVGLAVLHGLSHRLETGLEVSADCLLERQRYAAGTEEILLVPRVQMVATLVIGIRL